MNQNKNAVLELVPLIRSYALETWELGNQAYSGTLEALRDDDLSLEDQVALARTLYLIAQRRVRLQRHMAKIGIDLPRGRPAP